ATAGKRLSWAHGSSCGPSIRAFRDSCLLKRDLEPLARVSNSSGSSGDKVGLHPCRRRQASGGHHLWLLCSWGGRHPWLLNRLQLLHRNHLWEQRSLRALPCLSHRALDMDLVPAAIIFFGPLLGPVGNLIIRITCVAKK
ncbi:hypothetical protein B296_00031430, partial [Ensete ventricosum]